MIIREGDRRAHRPRPLSRGLELLTRTRQACRYGPEQSSENAEEAKLLLGVELGDCFQLRPELPDDASHFRAAK